MGQFVELIRKLTYREFCSNGSRAAQELPPPTGIAFGEVACARCAITNKFALHSLARNFVLFKKRESFRAGLVEARIENGAICGINPQIDLSVSFAAFF